MGIENMTKNIIAAATIAAVSVYGGMRYEQYKDSTRPFNVVEKSGICMLVDKAANKEMPAQKAAEAYLFAKAVQPTMQKYGSALSEIIGESKQ